MCTDVVDRHAAFVAWMRMTHKDLLDIVLGFVSKMILKWTKDDKVICKLSRKTSGQLQRMHDTQTNTTTNIPKTTRTPYVNKTIPNRTNLRPGYKRTNRTASNKYTSITHNEHGTYSKRTQTNDEKFTRSDRNTHQFNYSAHQ